jgi:hypothetical protein
MRPPALGIAVAADHALGLDLHLGDAILFQEFDEARIGDALGDRGPLPPGLEQHQQKKAATQYQMLICCSLFMQVTPSSSHEILSQQTTVTCANSADNVLFCPATAFEEI